MKRNSLIDNAYIKNLFALLAALVVLGHFADQIRGNTWVAKGIFLFVFSFHMPLLFYVLGAIFKEIENDVAKVRQVTLYSLCLYVLMKLTTAVINTVIQGRLTFALLSENGAAWVFFTAAVYFSFAYLLRRRKKDVLLMLAIVLAFAAGYEQSVSDFLVASRTIVFSPFFVIGWMRGVENMERMADGKWKKACAFVVLAIALAVAVCFAKQLYFMRPMLVGRNSYMELKKLQKYGPLLRLAAYAVGSILTWAVLTATPSWSLGKLIGRIGTNFIQVYFLNRPLLYILSAFHIFDGLKAVSGIGVAVVLWGLCSLLCVWVLSADRWKRPFVTLYSLLGAEREQVFDQLEATWDQASIRKRKYMYLRVYTVVFFLTFLIAFSPFLLKGKSFVWAVSDGKTLHMPYLIYVGRYLRRFALGLLKGDFSIPMFDISIGVGDDVIGMLNPIGKTEPLLLLSALVPARYSEYLYCFLIIFRIYLAGFSFAYLCKYFHKRSAYTLIGSVVYCFGAYAIYVGVRHPFFIPPMIVLPLLIVGTEKILRKEKPLCFVLAISYSALCGYYHLYMETILVGVYALVRFFEIYKDHRAKELFGAVCRGIGSYCLGIGISAVIFFPSVVEFLNGDRSGVSNYIPAQYTWRYFRDRTLRMFAPTPGAQNGWSYPSYAAIALFALILLCFSKGRKSLKRLAVVAFAFYWISFCQLIMNGFQYASNRWTFGLGLVVSFVVVEMLPELLQLTAKQRTICFINVVAYMVLIFSESTGRKLSYVTVGAVFVTLTLLVLVMPLGNSDMATIGEGICAQPGGHRVKRMRALLCLILVMANTGIFGIYKFAEDQGNYTAEYSTFDSINQEIATSPELVAASNIPDLQYAPPGRVDSSSFIKSWASMWRVPGMLPYSAAVNRGITEFFQVIENGGQVTHFNVFSTGQQTMLGALLSQKYHMEGSGNRPYVPYGYQAMKITGSGYVIYENRYALPWGYTYDDAISYDTLDGLNGVQALETMLQAVALENVRENETVALRYDEELLPYEIEETNCSWKDGKIEITENNASVKLTFSMPASSEGYVRLDRFDINDTNITTSHISVNCENVTKVATVLSDKNSYYRGREDYLFDLGYSDEERHELTITFPKKGLFNLNDIELYALPMENYPERVEALRAEPLENIQWGTNSLTGTVDLSRDKILCVSVPYSKGWTATVDGEEAEILRGNYMFMCLPLTAGHHDIEFHYCSPGIKLGAVVSLCSAGIVIWMLVRDRKKKGRKTDGV